MSLLRRGSLRLLFWGRFWEPFWLPKWTSKLIKNRSKNDLEAPRAPKRDPGTEKRGFGTHLGTILAPLGTKNITKHVIFGVKSADFLILKVLIF